MNKFVRATCPDCGEQQKIFERASTKVRCLVCGATIAKPTGGKAKIKGKTEVVK